MADSGVRGVGYVPTTYLERTGDGSTSAPAAPEIPVEHAPSPINIPRPASAGAADVKTWPVTVRFSHLNCRTFCSYQSDTPRLIVLHLSTSLGHQSEKKKEGHVRSWQRHLDIRK